MENIFYTSSNYEDLLLEVLKFSNDKNAVIISTDEIYDCIQKKQSALLFDMFITLLKWRNSDTYIFSNSNIDSVISNLTLKTYIKNNYEFKTIFNQ